MLLHVSLEGLDVIEGRKYTGWETSIASAKSDSMIDLLIEVRLI